jgi:hypothetical protein
LRANVELLSVVITGFATCIGCIRRGGIDSADGAGQKEQTPRLDEMFDLPCPAPLVYMHIMASRLLITLFLNRSGHGFSATTIMVCDLTGIVLRW